MRHAPAPVCSHRMDSYHLTVVAKDDGSVYIIGECPRCGASKVHDVEEVEFSKVLPCPCGHEVAVTPALDQDQTALRKISPRREWGPIGTRVSADVGPDLDGQWRCVQILGIRNLRA